jgi:hypothetical protein
MDAPITPFDNLSRFPTISPRHDGLSFASIRPQNRRPWPQSPKYPRSNSRHPPLAQRSMSTSAVPVILHRQMRAGLIHKPPQRVPPTPRSTSYYEQDATYLEDTTDYIVYNRHASSSAVGYAAVSSSPLIPRNESPNTRVVELVTEPIRPSPEDTMVPVVKRPYPVNSMTCFSATGSTPTLSSMSIVRKPVQSMPGIPVPLTSTLCSAKADISTMEMREVPQKSDECDTPEPPFSSPRDKSPPESPSPSGRDEAILKRRLKQLGLRKEHLPELGVKVAGGLDSTQHGQLNDIMEKDHQHNDPITSLLDPLPYMLGLLQYCYNAITAENINTVKKTGWLIARILFVLYLAACLWNVVLAIHSAILKALEPIIRFLGFLLWLTAKK